MSAPVLEKPDSPEPPRAYALPSPLPPTPTGRKRWTVDDCQFLWNLGLLKGRFELIDGEILVKSYQSDYGLLPPSATGRKRWTRVECELLEDAGLLKERYELIDGEIILKVGQKERHASGVIRLVAYCLSVFGVQRVRTQATVEVRADDILVNQPEPDVFVLRDQVAQDIVQATEVILAIEVCDSTQDTDYGSKPRLYARAGIAEYWVLDLPRRLLVVFHTPENGEWSGRDEYSEDRSVAPLCAPNSPVRVGDLLP